MNHNPPSALAFDERLGLSEDVKVDLYSTVVGPTPHVLFTSSYHVPLTVDTAADGGTFIRAATGAEVMDALTTGDAEVEQQAWSGDGPTLVHRIVRWQQHQGDMPHEEKAVLVWEAEVLFRDGHGQGCSFFAHQTAAAAEAFSSVLAQPTGQVFECQIVPYACARQFAPLLLQQGDAEARRLTRYELSPLQPYSAPRPIPLPP